MQPAFNDPAEAPEALRRVEAARYALLRRLSFAMRHHMVVHLQPIGMITEVMERRLLAPNPDLAQVHEAMGKINGFTRAAVESCMDVVSWLAPEAGKTVSLDEGVEESLSMLRSHFSFRGFTIRNEIAGTDAVPRAALRHVMPAALLALTDTAAAPADVVLSRGSGAQHDVISIAVLGSEGVAGFAGEAPFRLLAWHEVEALGQAEGVAVSRQGHVARLKLPLAAA